METKHVECTDLEKNLENFGRLVLCQIPVSGRFVAAVVGDRWRRPRPHRATSCGDDAAASSDRSDRPSDIVAAAATGDGDAAADDRSAMPDAGGDTRSRSVSAWAGAARSLVAPEGTSSAKKMSNKS